MGESFNIISWLMVTVPLLYSPGPINILCASSGSLVGIRKTIPMIAALQLPAILYALCIGYGLMSFFLYNPFFIKSVMFLGGVYLFILTYQMSQTKENNMVSSQKSISIKNGMIISVLNGKLIPVLILIFSISLSESSSFFTVLLITISTALVGITANLTWALLGSYTNRLIGKKLQKIVFSGILSLVGVWLVVQSFQY